MISKSTIDFIKEAEGVEYKVYKDSAGLDTIGAGHLILPGEKFPNKITDEEVDALLFIDLNLSKNAVLRHTNIDLNQNQFDALCSLVFNIGPTAFKNSTVVKLINMKSDKSNISKAWMMWNKIKKYDKVNKLLYFEPVEGLTNRRKKEIDLYFKK